MIRVGMRLFFVVLWTSYAETPVMAQTPEEIIRWVYASHAQPGPANAKGIAHLSAPAQRAQFFSQRMIAFFKANDSYGTDLARACLDFALDIPGNDYDAREIARSLTIATAGDPERPSVTASFTTFGQPAKVVYDFISEDGFMRIDDIAGYGWRVSLMPCTENRAAATTPKSGSYCYLAGNDSLRIDLRGDGSVWFDFLSWQSNGHSCSGRGQARVISGGWLFEEYQEGRACRIGFMIAQDGGIALTDPNHQCKMRMCGQRATIDGIRFARSAQINCAQMPVN